MEKKKKRNSSLQFKYGWSAVRLLKQKWFYYREFFFCLQLYRFHWIGWCLSKTLYENPRGCWKSQMCYSVVAWHFRIAYENCWTVSERWVRSLRFFYKIDEVEIEEKLRGGNLYRTGNATGLLWHNTID